MDTRGVDEDWFGEGETEESPRRRWLASPERPPPGAGRALRRPVRPQVAVRLAGVVAVFLVVVVVAVVLVGGGDAAGADRGYLSALAAPAADSQAVGVSLAAALGSPTLTPASLNAALNSLLARQQRDTALVSAINPAPRLRNVQLQALDAMRLRTSGLNGLLTAFHDAEANPKQTSWPAALAAQANRLLTSDVIWQDLVETPTRAQLQHDHTPTTPIPASTFMPNPNLAAPQTMATTLAKLNGTPTTTTGPPILKLGDSGPAVAAWQTQLNTWLARQPNPTLLTVDGQYGQTTQTATEQLQTATHITPDGTVGPATRAALNNTHTG